MDKKFILSDLGPLVRQTDKNSQNSAIPSNILRPQTSPEVKVATAHPIPIEEPERFVREEDCPAIEVCRYVDNVRGCCQKGDPFNTSSNICIQGLLLLIAKIHGVLPDRDSGEID